MTVQCGTYTAFVREYSDAFWRRNEHLIFTEGVARVPHFASSTML